MSAMEQSLPPPPSLSSSSDGKKRKRYLLDDSTPPPPCASAPSLPGPSSAGATSESAVFEDRVALDRLSSLVSGPTFGRLVGGQYRLSGEVSPLVFPRLCLSNWLEHVTTGGHWAQKELDHKHPRVEGHFVGLAVPV
ncbi:hypothetical protein E2C01_097716 [Portunus trituberculatus]|uniref:Uncharacterized protein n=1 Tax=Portunus trituberculatus TaxID=210409 RepID=A0A5B7K5J8_PORTR|nr:hypothetical protein [Portunus trituberculatus]